MRKASGFIRCAFLAIGLMVVLFLVIFNLNSEKELVSAEVPEIEIILEDTTLDEINAGSKKTTYAGNEMILMDNGDEYVFDNVEIRGRGNASWVMDKKSYRIKTSQKANLLGLGRLKKWGLISNGIDDTLMRNDLGQHIASILYDEYPIRGEFANLKIDDRNLGLYYVVKLVGVGKENVDLRDPMGILLEIDNAYCDSDKGYEITTIMSDCISVKDSVVSDGVNEILDIFMSDYNEFEAGAIRGDYDAVEKKVDILSLVEYYLLSEFSSNPDAYVTSWYLHKDGESNKIHAGIGWDFDAAFGNWNWGSGGTDFYSPIGLMKRAKSLKGWDENDNNVARCKALDSSLISPTMCYMVAMPEFRELVGKIYREKLMNKREEIISYIREKANYIRDAAIANNELWGRGDFDEAVEYLIWWVDKRFDFFDDLYGRIELVPEES